MEEASKLQKQYDLDGDEFQALATDFHDLLTAQVALLESMVDQADFDESRLALQVVTENGTMFGAKRLLSVLPGATSAGESGGSSARDLNYPLILNEMKSVIEVLPPPPGEDS